MEILNINSAGYICSRDSDIIIRSDVNYSITTTSICGGDVQLTLNNTILCCANGQIAIKGFVNRLIATIQTDIIGE